MGFALARAARAAGARVEVVSGPTALSACAGVALTRVTTAQQMRREVLRRSRRAQVVIAAAAVSDWRVLRVAAHKIKRSSRALRLTLIPNPDIIREAASRRRLGQVFIGFALETRDAQKHARRKLARKGLDMIVANGSASLGSNIIRAVLIDRREKRSLAPMTKARLARIIIREAEKRLGPRTR